MESGDDGRADDREVRLTEVGALGQERFAGGFGECIRKAVAEIEGGGVPAFSVLAPGGSGQFGLFRVHGNDLQIGAHDEEVEFAASCFALAGFDETPVSSMLAADTRRLPAAVMALRGIVARSGSPKKIDAKADVSITISLA